jgi:hypothetical protein
MHTQTLGTMREFKTKNFLVRAEALEDNDVDLSWDDDGSVREGIENGTFIVFTAHVEVFYRGQSVGEDYLGSCIYKSFEDFMDHKECGRQNRTYALTGQTGRCGSYFSDMIREAIAAARKTLTADRPYIRNTNAEGRL